VTEYFHNENFEGVGQGPSFFPFFSSKVLMKDHLICLNRLNANTGPEWIEDTLTQLDSTLLSAQVGERRKIPLHIWWGWLDGMVPRKGQCRFPSPFDLCGVFILFITPLHALFIMSYLNSPSPGLIRMGCRRETRLDEADA